MISLRNSSTEAFILFAVQHINLLLLVLPRRTFCMSVI